jgi:predicted ABC-class ATPase
MKKTITLSRALYEAQILGLPPVETFSVTGRDLRAFNSGKPLASETARKWLMSLRDGKPVSWQDVEAALG